MTDNYKDIVVYLDDDEGNAARLGVAAQIAARCKAHLTGLAVEHDEHLSNLIGMRVAPFLVDELRRQETFRLRRLREQFDSVVEKAGLVSAWLGASAPLVPALARQARRSDLLVMGQDDVDNESVHGDGGILGPVVLSAGVPVLAVPYIGTARTPGGRVLLAWDGSRESTRAAHDALPLLRQADAVEVVSVEPQGRNGSDGSTAADAALHLTRLGITANARTIAASDIDAANMLLSHASDFDADLLVMGAYGHSRLREFFLGGVTKEIFKSMTVPVLLSH